ncbi:MAG: hypothetical protein E6K52_11925 [Gammaproteobacteria bacterium]|nr:MAG: hypothetical protein E6K52_11925 [Gammaproteobacteria bacterium]
MAPSARLPVILLWHMHQPQYRDALTGQYVLPWTYLHAIKDYTDMAAHLEGNPAARAVVNFTPVLIEQLEEISRRVAEHLRSGAPLPDPVLGLLGPEPVPTDPPERARDHRGNAGDAGARQLRIRPTDSGPGRVVSPRVARRSRAAHAPAGESTHGAGPRLHARAAARAPRALRRSRELGRAALPAAVRAGAMRAFRHALRASDHPVAAGFPVGARCGTQHGAARARLVRRRGGAGGVACCGRKPGVHAGLRRAPDRVLAVGRRHQPRYARAARPSRVPLDREQHERPARQPGTRRSAARAGSARLQPPVPVAGRGGELLLPR